MLPKLFEFVDEIQKVDWVVPLVEYVSNPLPALVCKELGRVGSSSMVNFFNVTLGDRIEAFLSKLPTGVEAYVDRNWESQF